MLFISLGPFKNLWFQRPDSNQGADYIAILLSLISGFLENKFKIYNDLSVKNYSIESSGQVKKEGARNIGSHPFQD